MLKNTFFSVVIFSFFMQSCESTSVNSNKSTNGSIKEVSLGSENLANKYISPDKKIFNMPQHLQYLNWNFNNKKYKSLNFKFTIHKEPDNKDGFYLSPYNSYINDILFYFGIQSFSSNGVLKKGLIFSRWKTRDLNNVRVSKEGSTESAGYEEDFVSVRKPYNWTNHSYNLKLDLKETDDIGDWYNMSIHDLTDNTEDTVGSIRFEKTQEEKRGISGFGTTFTEIFSKDAEKKSIINMDISVDNFSMTDFSNINALPETVESKYIDVKEVDTYFEKETGKIRLLIGENLKQEHKAGTLY